MNTLPVVEVPVGCVRARLRRALRPVPRRHARGVLAAIAIHAALLVAAVSGAARGPVLAIIAAVGDKGAHALAGFALVLPALLLLRGSRRAWLAASVVSVAVLPAAWESPALGLSLVFDAGDVLANLAGAGLAVLASGAVRLAFPGDDAARADALLRGMRRAGPALVASLLLMSTLAAVAAFEGTIDLPQGATRTFPADGFLDVEVGQTVNWSWSGGYVDFWWEEESRGRFSGGDTFGAFGCWYVDAPASLRIAWANTADSPEPDTVVNYTVDVINGTEGPTEECTVLSGALPPPQEPTPVWLFAAVLVPTAIVLIVFFLWLRRKPRTEEPPREPDTTPPPPSQ